MNKIFRTLHERSRKKKHQLFMRHIRPAPQMRILNVGATGTSTGLEAQFESIYPWPQAVTGGGPWLHELEDYMRSFPGVTGMYSMVARCPSRTALSTSCTVML